MSQQGNDASASAPVKPKKSWLRRLLYVGVFFAIVLLALVAALPAILSGTIGRSVAQDAINGQVEGKVVIDSVSLGWFGGQKIDGFTLLDPDGNKVAQLDEVSTDLSLLAAIFGDYNLGRTVGKGLSADIIVDEKGNNLLRAIAAKNPSPPSNDPVVIPSSLGIRFELVDTKQITLSTPGAEKVTIDDLSVKLDAPTVTEPVTLRVTGKSSQGQMQGTFDVDGKVAGAVTADGTLVTDPQKYDVDITAKANDLPVDAVDRLLDQKGLVTALLGEQLNVELTAKGAGAYDVKLVARSPNVDANFDAKLAADTLTTQGSGKLRLTATPAFSDALAKQTPDTGGPIALKSPVIINVDVDRFSAALENVTPKALSAKATVKATGDIPLAGDPSLEGVVVRNLNGSVDAENLAGIAMLALNADLVTPDGPGMVKVDGRVNGLFADTWTPMIDKADIDVTTRLSEVPVALVDRLGALEGLAIDALGPKANAEVRIVSGDAGRKDVKLDVSTQRLIANWTGQLAGENLRATGSGSVTQTITPGLVTKLAGESGMTLKQPVTMKLQISDLDAMLLDLKPATIGAKVKFDADSDVAITGDPTLGDVTIRGLSGNVESAKLAEAIQLKFNADLRTRDGDGRVDVNGSIAELFGESWSADMQKMKANVTAQIDKLPTLLVDRIGGTDGLLVDALGPQLNAEITSKSTGADAAEIAVLLNTQRVQTNPKFKLDAKNKLITLTEETDVRVEATRTLAGRFLHPDSGIALNSPSIRTTLKLTAFEAPLPGEGDPAFQPAKTKLSARILELSGADVNVDALGPGGGITLSNANVEITGPLDNFTVQASTEGAVRSNKGEYARALGGKVKIDTKAMLGINPDHSLKPIDAKIAATSQSLDAVVPLKLTGDFASATITGGKVNYQLQPATLTDFALVEPGGVTLAEPVTMRVDIPSVSAPLSDFSLARVKAKANATLDALKLAGDPQVAGATISGATTDVSFDGAAGQCTLALNGQATMPGQAKPGPLIVNATIAKLFNDGELAMDRADVAADVELGGFPTGFAEAITGMSGKLVPVAGSTVDVKADVKVAGLSSPRGTADVTLTTPADPDRFKLDAGVKLDDLVTLTRPLDLKMVLTPKAWEVWVEPALAAPPAEGADATAAKPAPPFKLVEPTEVHARVESLSYPMAALLAETPAPDANAAPVKPKIDLAKVKIDANLKATKPLLVQGGADQQRLRLTNLTATANARDMTQPLAVTLKTGVQQVFQGDVPRNPALTNPGSIDVNAKLTDVMLATGDVNVETLSADATVVGKNVPVALVDQLMQQNGLVRAALGPRADVDVKTKLVKMDGPVDVTLTSTNAKSNIRAKLADGKLLLREDATAELVVTDKLSRQFLNHPLLKQVIRSNGPVTVVAYANGFSIPVRDYNIENVLIDKVTVTPGKMTVHKAGLIKTLLELPTKISSVKQGKIGALFGKDELDAWFTPVDISMKNGVATYSRMDMLLGDDYQVATWGVLNLSTQPHTADGKRIPGGHGHMVLGIDERALRRVYGITQWITEENYVDQFVMKGKLETFGPDTTDMLARLTLLTAEGATGAVAGKAGDILGLVRKTLSKADKAILGRKFDPPPPPRKPFPWPEQEYTEEEKALIEKRTGKATGDQPTQQPTDEPKQAAETKKEDEKKPDAKDLLKKGLEGLFKK